MSNLNVRSIASVLAAMGIAAGMASHAAAQGGQSACAGLPSHADLRAALAAARAQPNGGFDLTCGPPRQSRRRRLRCRVHGSARRPMAWQPRDLGAEGQHRERVQPAGPGAVDRESLLRGAAGRSLFGLQESNPVNTASPTAATPADFGRANDPMVGQRIGGVNVFGGGLALYTAAAAARRRSASAATPHAPITTSHGAPATSSISITSPPASAATPPVRRTTSSMTSRRRPGKSQA